MCLLIQLMKRKSQGAGLKGNRRRLESKSAQAWKEIGAGSIKKWRRLKKKVAKAQKKSGEGSIIFFWACLEIILSLSQESIEPSPILIWACLNLVSSLSRKYCEQHSATYHLRFIIIARSLLFTRSARRKDTKPKEFLQQSLPTLFWKPWKKCWKAS